MKGSKKTLVRKNMSILLAILLVISLFPGLASAASAPTITSISPISGLAGTKITVYGTGLNNVTQVVYQPPLLPFGFDCLSITHINDTSLTAVLPQLPPFPGLDLSTGIIKVHSSDGNSSYPNNNAIFTYINSDTTAPSFDEAPAVDADATYITLTASIDEGGTIYYMAVPKDSAAPTSAEVAAGAPYGVVTPTASGSQVASAAPYSKTFHIKGLAEKTNYDVYVVGEDDESTPNVMAAPVKLTTLTTENNALYFDEDASVTGLNGIGPDEFTVEFKLCTSVSESDASRYLYKGKDSDGNNIAIGLTYIFNSMQEGGPTYYDPLVTVTAGNKSYQMNRLIGDGKWWHIAITSSQTSGTKIYLNGLQDTLKAEDYTQLNSPIKLPVTDVQMGGGFLLEEGEESLTFALDDFRIWDKGKTADEIKEDMKSELLPPFPQDLVRYYDFNKGIGGGDNTNPPVNTLPDKLGNGNGILNNFDLFGGLNSNWFKYTNRPTSFGNSTVTPTTATFDKNIADTGAGHYRDVVLNLTLNGNTLNDVQLNGTSIGSENYTVSGSIVTLKKEYLATLSTGAKTFTLDMNAGTDPKVTVTVIDTSTPSTPVPAPGFSPEPDPGPGTQPGTTGVPNVTPEGSNHLLVKVSPSIISTPNTGDAAPTGTGVIDPYTAGSDIPGVDTVVNRYIGLYEVDSNNKVVKFKLIVLGEGDINPGPTNPVPGFSPEPDPGPGTQPGTTGVPNVTPEGSNHLLVKVSPSIISTPNTGDAAPTGTGVIDPYTAGSDIPGVDTVVNRYIGLYEVDSNNKVVKFKLIVLGEGDINPGPTNPVPGFSPEPDPGPGTQPGTTGVPNVTPEGSNHLLVKVSPSIISTPNTGDAAPTGTGVIDPYTAGSDIPGVDTVVNRYIGLYEVNSNNEVVKFKLITLTNNDVNPGNVPVPGIPTAPTAAAGNGQATVSFIAPTDNGGSPITGYIVTSNPGNITATGTGTTITVTGLTNGTTYTFTVKAVNAIGNGADSIPSNAVTPAAPSSGGGGGGGGSSPAPTPAPTPVIVTGDVVDNKSGQSVKGIDANVTTEANGTKTVAVKSEEAILVKQPDGTKTPLSDISKLGFSTTEGTNSNVHLSADGTIQVKNLANGTESKFAVTLDLGNGQKITIGTLDIKVGSKGEVSLTSTLIDPYGIITDPTTREPIVGANVTLYYANTERNKVAGKNPDTIVPLPILEGFEPNDNKNPQVSDGSGAYAFMVFPTSDYYIVATKDGYEQYKSTTISVEQDIVKWDFKMNKPIIGVKRLAGLNRVDTAIEIAKANYSGKVSSVVLTTAENYPDALTGSVLAYKLNAPILLVGSTDEEQEKILAYMKSNLDLAGTVYILGGTAAVSSGMEAKVTASGFKNITRLGGYDRYETAIKIAEYLDVKQGTPIVLAYGENYPDALSISSAAAAMQSPILLVQRDGISDAVKQEIAKIKPIKFYIVGLQGVISTEVENQVAQITSLDKENIVRIGGVDRFETSLEVAKYFNLSGQNVCVATGNIFPDALAGSVYAANSNAPIILVDGNLSDNAMAYLKTRKMTGVTIFGGEAVVSKDIEQNLSVIIRK